MTLFGINASVIPSPPRIVLTPRLTNITVSLLACLIVGPFQAVSSQAARSPERVRIAVPVKSVTFLPFYFGKDKGFFRDEGIELEPIITTATTGVAALQAGEVDYTAAASVAMRAAILGAPLRAVVFMQTKLSFSLIGQPGMTPDKVNTVAVSGIGTLAHYAALAIMEKLGQSGRKDRVTYIGTTTTRLSYVALTSKAVDAASLTPPFTSMATTSGYAYLGDAFHVPGVQGGLATTTTHLMEKRGQVRGVLRAILRAMDAIANRRAEVIDYIQKEFRLDPEVAVGTYDIIKRTLNLDGDIDPVELRQVIEQMKKDAKVTADVPVDRVVDLSVLHEVRAELNKKKP
jgi:ABC-type nitrate/sulfonate/bicarbonate transport system substrate-binding protein